MSFDPTEEEYRELEALLKKKAFTGQVGGTHYKTMRIQPAVFCQLNGIPWIEGNIIKYVCRWKQKNGVEDLHKIKHYVDMLIDLEERGNG